MVVFYYWWDKWIER